MEELFRHENQRLLECSSDDDVTEFVARRGRAASKIRGVAAVMEKWPGQLIPSTKACLLPLFVLVFTFTTTVLLIMAYSPSPPPLSLPTLRRVVRCADEKAFVTNAGKTSIVFPVITDVAFNTNVYVKPLKYLKKTFPLSAVKLLVLVNDTNISEDNNANALNRIIFEHDSFDNDDIKMVNEEILIERRLLSQFIFQSPLKQNWKELSNNIIPFLTRVIAIWEHGGIAIDPNRLKEEHIDKLMIEIQNTRKILSKINNTEAKYINNTKKLHNNIRDILEDVDSIKYTDTSQESLESDETKVVEKTLEAIPMNGNVIEDLSHMSKSNIDTSKISTSDELNNVQKLRLLPKIARTMFLPTISQKQGANDTMKYFFDFMRSLGKSVASTETNTNYDTDEDGVDKNINSDSKSFVRQPNTDFARQRRNDRDNTPSLNIGDNINKIDIEPEKTLVIDVKGYLIASRSYCHAFIGEIFNNVQRYPKVCTPMELVDTTWNTFCHSNTYSDCSEIVLLL